MELRLALLKIDFPYHFENTKFLLDKIIFLNQKIEDPLTLVQPKVFNLEIGMRRFLIASMS